VAALLQATGAPVPACLRRAQPFYAVTDNTLTVQHAAGAMQPIALPEGVVRFHLQRRVLTPLQQNRAASVFAVENGYRLVEFHSKANALTDESMEMVALAATDHGRGILVHNDAQHYSAGVDLNAFLEMIDAGDWRGIDLFLTRFQQAVAALKYAPVPVVGAPSGLALGGGFEVLLHCDQRVMHTNSVVGLVESSVGLLPAGGGVKETYWRWYQVSGSWEEAAWQAWMNLGYGATASSPRQAERLQYFLPAHDIAVMNRDRLYVRSVQALDALCKDYSAPSVPQFELAGGDVLQRMAAFMDAGITRGDFFAHDKTVAMQIATVMCSDDGQAVAASEQDLYDRERAAFIRLAQTPQTRARIHSLLHEGGAVRN
jgi:3-hydroxyacyl-CoA dehydrogenase